MQLKSITIKNFRCFADLTLNFDNKFVLISGNNGTGKTSLLEAIHYLCYLRSFRTHSPRELVRFEQDHFFIKASCVNNSEENQIQVGFTGKNRLVKINTKAISSYKELLDHYRVITLTEDDLNLIKDGPEIRRSFIDQQLVLYEPSFMEIIRKFRLVLNNRNSLLKSGRASSQRDSHNLWTEQLWNLSCIIQHKRMSILAELEDKVNKFASDYFGKEITIGLRYRPKKMDRPYKTFEEFDKHFTPFYQEEIRYGRSLFGAHLDDFVINFKDKKSRLFASRGQQKLIVSLLKIAQVTFLASRRGPSLFLLDDFMTDLDENRAQLFLPILDNLEGQVFFTSPLKKGHMDSLLSQKGAQKVLLTI